MCAALCHVCTLQYFCKAMFILCSIFTSCILNFPLQNVFYCLKQILIGKSKNSANCLEFSRKISSDEMGNTFSSKPIKMK